MTGLWLITGLAQAQDMELRADHVRVEAGRVWAEGEVQVDWSSARITAEFAELDGDTLRLVSGVVDDGESRLRFEQAVVDLEAETLQLRGAWISFCGCEEPPWWIELGSADVQLQGWTIFEQGRVVVGGVPILGVPKGAVRVGERRWGVELPRVGRGPDGFQASVPTWARWDQGRVELEPEWRRSRGGRLIAGVETDSAQVRTSVGYDRIEGRPRGAVSGSGSLDVAGLAVEGDWVSDADWRGDYAGSWIDRSLPFTTQRARVGLGAARFEVLGAQPEMEALELVPGVVFESPSLGWKALTADGLVRLDRVGEELRAEVGSELSWSRGLGPVELRALGAGRVLGYGQTVGRGAVDGRTELGAMVPVWAAGERWTRTLEIGVEGGLGGRVGDLGVSPGARSVMSLRDPLAVRWGGIEGMVAMDGAPARAWVSPVLHERWWFAGDTALDAEIRVPVSTEGIAASARVGVDHQGWQLGAQGVAGPDGALYGGRGGFRDERFELGIAAWQRSGELDANLITSRVAFGLPLERGELRPGLDVAGSVEGMRETGVSLGWSSHCDCLDVGARLATAEDREGAQVGVWVDLRPE